MAKAIIALGTLVMSLFAAYWFQDNAGQIAGALTITAGGALFLAILGLRDN